MCTNKKELRKIFKQKRQQLSIKYREEADARITDHVLCRLDRISGKPMIYCYVSTKEETDTHLLLSSLWEKGYRTAVPKVESKDGIMNFYEIQDFSDLKSGYFGIYEPVHTKHPVADNGIMIMPGVAFDHNRNRLGYGGGFYDRFLKCSAFISDTIAIAYQVQIAKALPSEPYDIRPDHIITEVNIYE